MQYFKKIIGDRIYLFSEGASDEEIEKIINLNMKFSKGEWNIEKPRKDNGIFKK